MVQAWGLSAPPMKVHLAKWDDKWVSDGTLLSKPPSSQGRLEDRFDSSYINGDVAHLRTVPLS